ncbi:MAG TPA: hypothetical protein VFH23_13045 [Jiangellaceae bacterium]|nr:hypothetical protein [Jiangellaceae bacterium]
MASDLATIAAGRDTHVRDPRDQVILKNIVWLFVNGHTVDANRETIVDPDGGGGFSVELLDEAGLTPATRASAAA